MGNEVNKRINVWINGVQVENNLKSIRSAIAKTTSELNKMTIGSDEYIEHSKKLKDLKAIYEEHRKELKSTYNEIEGMKTLQAGAIASMATAAAGAVKSFVSSTQEYVEAFSTIDDAMIGVMKTTGMTREEVEALNLELGKIDTRTSQEELLTISQIGGRMGLAKNQILDFTKAVDQANVALGDSFQGGAEEISSVLGKVALAFKETREANIGDSLTRIGSAINEVGSMSNATEPNIASFVQRVGSMPEAFRPSVQEAIALGAAFEESSIDAEVASRAFGIIMGKATTNVEGFAKVMKQPVEAVKELINTNPTRFFTEFARSLHGMDATQIGETLKGLKLNADGVVKIVGAMSGSADRFNEILQTSNAAFSENVSLMNEFNTVNNNSAAQLEKARNAAIDAKAALGESLLPVISQITEKSASAIQIAAQLVKWGMQHKAVVMMLVGALTSYVLIRTKATIAARAHTVQLSLEKAGLATATTFTNLYALAKARMTRNTIAAANAQKALKAAFASTPWGAIITAVVTVATALYNLATRTTESEDAMNSFNEACSREQSEAELLFDKLKNTQEGTDDYRKALQELIDKYPEVMAGHIDERGRLIDINNAYRDIIQSIQTKMAMEAKDKAIQDAGATALEKQRKALDKIRENIKKQGKSAQEAQKIVSELKRMMDTGEGDWIEYTLSEGLAFDKVFAAFKNDSIARYVFDYRRASEELKKTTEEISESFDPLIQKPLSDVEKLKQKINELQNLMQRSDDKEPYKKQIQELQQQLAIKQKIAETSTSGTSSGNGFSTPGTESSGTSVKSARDRIADFYQELERFRNRQQMATLEGWEKTKQAIINSYDEMIEKARSLNQTETVSKLEEEKGSAIVEAGRKYISDFSESLDNAMEEADRMIQSANGNGDENRILSAVAGTRKQWAEKINTVKEGTAAIQKILDDDASLRNDEPNRMTQEQRDVFIEGVRNGLLAEERLTMEAMQAISSVIRQNVTDETSFITDKENELRRSRMTDYERQIEDIHSLYNAKIEAKRAEISALQQLEGTEGVDSEEIRNQIEQIEALISRLQQMEDAETSGVRKSSGNSWLNRLIDFDWKTLQENWQEGLDVMADAMREFSSVAFDIFSSINDNASNSAKKELDEFKETQDAKSEALQRQYDQGLISRAYYDAEVSKLNDETDAKEKELELESWKREKKLSISQAVINGAVAITKCFAQAGPIGAILAAMTAAVTAAQVAAIAAQPEPYATGGYINGKKYIMAGEAGPEWIASNRLLTDSSTAPIISALQQYQEGNSNALEMLQPDTKIMYQPGKTQTPTFVPGTTQITNITNNATGMDDMLKEIRKMNDFLSDPKNRQAYISRKTQLKYEERENQLKEYARL